MEFQDMPTYCSVRTYDDEAIHMSQYDARNEFGCRSDVLPTR